MPPEKVRLTAGSKRYVARGHAHDRDLALADLVMLDAVGRALVRAGEAAVAPVLRRSTLRSSAAGRGRRRMGRRTGRRG